MKRGLLPVANSSGVAEVKEIKTKPGAVVSKPMTKDQVPSENQSSSSRQRVKDESRRIGLRRLAHYMDI